MFPQRGSCAICTFWARRQPGKVDQTVGIAHNYDELVDSPVELGTFPAIAVPAGRSDLPRCGRWQSADYDMAKLGRSPGQNHPCRGRLDAGPPVRRVHVPLPLSRTARRRRHGTRLRHRHRSSMLERLRTDPVAAGRCERARVLSSVECETHSSAVAGADRLSARDGHARSCGSAKA